MSTDIDYFSALPVEIISIIISFQDYEDRERCCFLSKYLYGIYKSTRTQFRLELDASRPTGVRVNSFVDREKLDINLHGLGHVNETSLEACLTTFRICELHLIKCHPPTLNRLFTKEFTFLFIRHMAISGIELDSLQVLPTLAPNLESLEIGIHSEGGLFTGTNLFTKLKTLIVKRSNGTNVLPAISSITNKMPSLTGLIADVGFFETFPTSFVAPSNLEYIEMNLMTVPVPISASNALTQLHVEFLHRVIRIEYPQPAPLSNVEIFRFVGYEISLYPTMQYYGIGDNLKTICLEMEDMETPDTEEERGDREDKPLDELFIDDQLWKSCSNLEYLLAEGDVKVKSLVHLASICTKLRFVSFESFLEDNGESNTQLLPKTGIKNIFLEGRLPDEDLQFLLDSGIDVVYERFVDPHEWLKRGYGIGGLPSF